MAAELAEYARRFGAVHQQLVEVDLPRKQIVLLRREVVHIEIRQAGHQASSAYGLRSLSSVNSTVRTINSPARPNTKRGMFWSMMKPNSSGEMMPLMLNP